MRVAWRAAAMTGLEPDHLLVQRSSLRVSQLGIICLCNAAPCVFLSLVGRPAQELRSHVSTLSEQDRTHLIAHPPAQKFTGAQYRRG